jgi:ornithine cyclodeaminase/alanine dehydrogenase-like protein (mu-crystallin family)
VILLTRDDLRGLLEPAAVLETVEEALRMEHAGTVRWSDPANLRIAGGPGQGRLRVKACSLDGPGVTGVRVLHFPAAGAETRWILLFDAVSGEPLAVVDEVATYGDRSFASVALVAHRVRADAVDTVAILGAGRIARAALAYVADRFPGAAVAIAARRDPAAAELATFAEERHGLDATPASFETAVRTAQVVFGCTSATEPIVRESWVAPGTVIASLEPRELEPALFAGADLRIVDAREPLREELDYAFGDGAADRVDATMAEVVGGAHPGRTEAGQRIVMVSQGLVSQDVLLAERLFRQAVARGIGAEIALPAPTPGPGR